jgi:DNA-binding CsgD family transcriptional regulator
VNEGYHHLPLPLLLAALSDVPQTLLLRAQLTPQRGILQKGGNAEIRVQKGRPLSCEIRDLQGRPLAQGQEAFLALQEMGRLSWHLSFAEEKRDGSAKTRQPEPVGERADYPGEKPVRRKTTALPPLVLRQRQVLNLADGTRTVQQIAALLHISSAEVTTILRRLRELNLISY